MTKKGMDVPPFATEERSPLKDLTNTTMDGSANLTHNQTNDPKRKGVQSWYARMSDEKKAEYNAKRRISRQQKKVAALDCASQDQFKQKFVPPLGIVQRTPFSDITNRQTKGTCATSTASISANTPQTHASGTCATSTASIPANTPQTHASETCATSTAPICQQQIGASANKQGGKGWYANLSDEKKAEHLRKLRMAREQKRTAALVLNVDVPQSSTQDYICTNEDISTIQNIMSVPPKTNLVGIGDAVLSVEDLTSLINGGVFLGNSVINAYIYCIRAQEHLRHRAGGNVHLETTYISAILKRDGKPGIAPSDHGHIIQRVHNYLQHDMVYIPVNIKNCHWYLAVVNAKMCEIQVLDSFGPDVLARDDLTLILQGLKKHLDIASESTNFSMGKKWQNLDVTSWPIKEYSYERVQEDGTSCGLFLTNYMEYWTGDELSDNVTQEDMTQLRRKLAVILHDSELNRLKGNPEFPEVVHTIDASEDTNEHSPTKHNMESESSNDLIKDKSPPCILPSRIVSENSRDLVGELCTFIMSIDDFKSLEKEWVVSSKPYPISISLKKIQDILKTDQAMDRKSFNMAVRILACDELLMLKDTPDHFMDLQFCSMVSEYARDPKLRTKPDIQSLAKLLGSWPGTDYSISSCRLIVFPYATLDHFILFVIDQHAKTVSILDSLGIYVASVELMMIQDLRYALKLQRIAFYLNQALEVAHPEWNDDIFYWHRRLPACVPKSTDRNLSGYYAFNSMLSWNGKDLNLPICKDGDQLRKRFLMHLLSYIDNEAAHNIPAVARELISRTRKY